MVKVKEIDASEIPLLAERHVLFTYLHACMFHDLSSKALAAGCTALGYEEVMLDSGVRPLLGPMSEIAGKLGFLKAVEYLQGIRGGPGILPVRLSSLEPCQVLILGAGVAGAGAASVAVGLGNSCHVVELYAARRDALKQQPPAIQVHDGSEAVIRALLPAMDVVLNAATFPSHSPTHLITRDMLKLMKPTAIIVDVSCDIAGAVETCRLTTHSDPVYSVDGIRHYCVDNIPGAVQSTSTRALCRATFPYVRSVAVSGLVDAARSDSALARAVVFARGKVTNAAFAAVLGVPARTVLEVLA
jgi:alanine dehydrogenase